MKYVLGIILIILAMPAATGCSGRAAADSSGRYVLDLRAIHNAHWATEALVYNRAIEKAYTKMICDYVDDGRVSGPESIDLQYLIDKGYLVVIPRNPYTGQDIKQSEEYSPGDVYFHFDLHDGGMLKLHFAQGNIECLPIMFAKGEVEDNWTTPDEDGDEKWLWRSFNGRTKTLFFKGVDDREDELDDFALEGGKTKLDEANERMRYMYDQMDTIMLIASHYNEEPGETLMETVDAFGRLNPAAWINPFTGMPMKQVQIWGPWGYPDHIKAKNPDKEEYAGNYSYVTYEWKGITWGVLAFYYIQENGELWVYACCTSDPGPYEETPDNQINEYSVHPSQSGGPGPSEE